MSDLQCAVTFVLAAVGDGEQARTLAERLRDRRVAVVCTDDSAASGEAAAAVSSALAVPVRAGPDLREGAASPGAVLEHLADQHRGETVLVLAAAQVLTAALRSLVPRLGPSYAARRPLRPGATVEIRGDGDSWVLDSWRGDSVA